MRGVSTRLDGRGGIIALGGIYVILAAGWSLLARSSAPLSHIAILGILVGGAGFTLLATGYWLPRTEIRPDLFSTVVRWSLSSIGVMLAVLLFVGVVAEFDDVVENALIMTALASVAGVGMGYHDAKAKTRARDAEERRQEAERYSRELERANRELQRYRTIVETVEDGIYVKDEDGHFTWVNDAYCEMTGYDREELIGSHASLVVDEETIETSREYDRRMIEDEEETVKIEADVQTADGGAIRAEATFALIQDDGEYRQVSVVRDITERTEREQRLESFASMLAHELRNPVNIGQIYSQQLPADAAPEAVEYVVEAFDRIEDMIEVMLVMTRGSEAVPEGTTVSLADVARSVWDEVEAPEARLEVAVDAEIEADETYVRHLFQNLFENAVEHGGSDVTVTVGDLPTGFYVEDDGAGIPTEERDEVFEAGYTTTGGQGGTGLGLAFVHELASAYEWECAVTEGDAGGARFEFTDVTTTPRVTG